MTAWLQTMPLKPKEQPATEPGTTQMALFQLAIDVLEIGRSLPKPGCSRAKRSAPPDPHANAPATAEASATRQAMFENGIMTVKSQV